LLSLLLIAPSSSWWDAFSLVELCQGGASGLSVLRTFRLLRILKLVRFMPALKRQLVVMLRTMDNVATFFALLVLFMFIFRSVTYFLFFTFF
jgi:voltage-dependent calcium channel T type alpha-1G